MRIEPHQSVILLAEDREDDIVILRKAFAQTDFSGSLFVVRDGDEAIAYLQGEGPYINRAEYPLPALLLLDLKMPRKNGFEVLKWIRLQPGLRTLRVIVLTSSGEMHDVNLAYLLGANSFLEKPADFERFVAVVHAIEGYWLWMSEAPETFRLPHRPRASE